MSTISTNSNVESSSLSVRKLRDDGSNWGDYKPRLRKAMGSKGLWRHVDGLAVAPKPYVIADRTPVLSDGKTPATDEQLEVKEGRILEFEKREYLAQHINHICPPRCKNKTAKYGRSHVENSKSGCDYEKHAISVRCRRSAFNHEDK